MEKTSARNDNGVKWSIDQYRTVGGTLFVHWAYERAAERATAYREAGIRCRRVAGDIYIHPDDKAKASRVDLDKFM